MNDFDINTTCCFTGHRILQKDFSVDKLEEVINNVLKRGYKTFLVGMAIGFDLKSVEILLKRKKEYNIDIIACIPCKNQDKFFKKEEKEKYQDYLKKLDKIVCFSNEYTKGCMRQRNAELARLGDIVIAYMGKDRSGAGQTVRMAKSMGKRVYNLYPELCKQ